MNRHEELIAAACTANPSLARRSFWASIATRLIESGEADAMEDIDDLDHRAFASLLREAGGRVLPDAFELPGSLPLIIVWEMSVTNRADVSVEKWFEFVADVLDETGNFAFACIVVDSDGWCHVSAFETFSGPPAADHLSRFVPWRVEVACPIDWRRALIDSGVSEGFLSAYEPSAAA